MRRLIAAAPRGIIRAWDVPWSPLILAPLVAALALFGSLSAIPAAAGPVAYHYDTAAYTYDAPARLSPPDTAATDSRGSPSGLVVGSWKGPDSDSGFGDAAETASEVATVAPRVVHGNSASSPATAYLYRLSDAGTGTYLKTGISQNPMARYSRTFMQDKEMEILQSGTRREMLNLERFIVERDPGPLNFERWAGRFAGDVP